MQAERKQKRKKTFGYNECMRELKSGSLRNLYLLYGEEDYLLQHLLNTILDAALNPDCKELDLLKIDLQNKSSALNFSEIRDNLKTPAFLSPRRTVLIRDSGLFASGASAYAEQAENLFAACDEHAVLIFVESKVDKRSRKILQSLNKYGAAVECSAEDLGTLITWSVRFLERYGIALRPSAAESLVERCGRSMALLRSELQKLSLACREEGRTSVDEAYVNDVCIADLRGGIFDLSDAISAGRPEETGRLYRNLLEQKSAPQYILFMLARHFRQILVAQSSASRNDLMKALGCGRFVADKLWRQKNRFTPAQARYIYLLCAETDYEIKSGRNDEQSALELLLLQAVSPPSIDAP